MTAAASCPRESEVLDLVAIDQWPGRADAELRAHAAHCGVCADLALVAAAFAAERDGAPAVRTPDAAVVWRRAEQRARQEAARRATRPMVIAQLAAAAAVAALPLLWWAAGAPGLALSRSFITTFAAAAPLSAGAWSGVQWVLATALGSAAVVPLGFYLARLADRPIGGASAPDRRIQ